MKTYPCCEDKPAKESTVKAYSFSEITNREGIYSTERYKNIAFISVSGVVLWFDKVAGELAIAKGWDGYLFIETKEKLYISVK